VAASTRAPLDGQFPSVRLRKPRRPRSEVRRRLPDAEFFRRQWTTDEREYLLILKIFTLALWPDVTAAINRDVDFLLREDAVKVQFELLGLSSPLLLRSSSSGM
jgi:hypothetical protein